MSEYLAEPNILVILIITLSAIAAVVLVMLYLYSRKEKPEECVTATSDWQSSGKIDFHCAEPPTDDKAPAAFLLRVEDYRTVESISGVEHMEIRWRSANLAEAKSVVVAHQNATDTGTKGCQIPRLVRT